MEYMDISNGTSVIFNAEQKLRLLRSGNTPVVSNGKLICESGIGRFSGSRNKDRLSASTLKTIIINPNPRPSCSRA